MSGYVISGIQHSVNEIFAVLGCYAYRSSGTTCWSHLQGNHVKVVQIKSILWSHVKLCNFLDLHGTTTKNTNSH
jgi:hypothetical protein